MAHPPHDSPHDSKEVALRATVLEAAAVYNKYAHVSKAFIPGVSPVPVSGKCWDAEEIHNLVDASLDFWLTTGRYNTIFEKALAQRVERRHALTCNSGSSANLLAMTALCSPLLKERRLVPGNEVITVAAGFPTTVAPIVQNGLVPVFVDVTPPTYNAIPEQIAAAVMPQTRAIFLAHTLGNPFDVAAVKAIAQRHDLWLIEDSCDALGSTYFLDGSHKPCGSFGHIATFSFYPAHHITMGEGGAVVCDDPLLCKALLSLRDWGRDCWCAPGHDDTCQHRYARQYADLPEGYDHKYVYSHLGYNLKITDMQAAVGTAQLKKLDAFTEARQRNFAHLYSLLATAKEAPWILPQATAGATPSWFGFLLTLHEERHRTPLLHYLNDRKIGTRLLFAGNITRQPCFKGVHCRIPFSLQGTDNIMRRTFWVGTYPGLTERHIEYTANCLLEWAEHA